MSEVRGSSVLTAEVADEGDIEGQSEARLDRVHHRPFRRAERRRRGRRRRPAGRAGGVDDAAGGGGVVDAAGCRLQQASGGAHACGAVGAAGCRRHHQAEGNSQLVK